MISKISDEVLMQLAAMPYGNTPETKLLAHFGELAREAAVSRGLIKMAKVILFKPSGKYYTEEEWRIPVHCIGPYDMANSPDFHRIDGGLVLVDTQEPWGYPHLL